MCNGNACSLACSGATPDACLGACVNLNTDDNNCGSCGHLCTTTTGAASHCDGTGKCNCVPKSKTQACGTTAMCGQAPDGCGNMISCGPACTSPLTCDASGQCVNTMCPTSCPMGNDCGTVSTIGCTTLHCGACGPGRTCVVPAGQTAGTCTCIPKTKSAACGTTVHCGPAPDGCGGSVDCGGCAAPGACCAGTCTPLGTNANCSACGAGCMAPNTCGGAGTADQCGCASEPDAILCARARLGCGPATLTDHCGVSRTRSCGTCPVPDINSGPGACTSTCSNNACVCPAGTPDMTSCGPAGAILSCGGICIDARNDPSNCGGCGGVCTSPLTCDGAGVPNKCGQCPAGQAACDDGSGGCVTASCCIATSQCRVTAPGNPCNMGCTNVVTGACKDTGVPVPDGTSCGPTSLCCGGTCTDKPAGAPPSCN